MKHHVFIFHSERVQRRINAGSNDNGDDDNQPKLVIHSIHTYYVPISSNSLNQKEHLLAPSFQ